MHISLCSYAQAPGGAGVSGGGWGIPFFLGEARQRSLPKVSCLLPGGTPTQDKDGTGLIPQPPNVRRQACATGF